MAEKDKAGRANPRLFGQKLQAQFLLELIETGSIRGAAARVGVHYTTVYAHAADDEAFRQKIDEARGEWEQSMVNVVVRGASEGKVIERRGKKIVEPGDWRAAAWLLEHHPATRQAYAGILRQKVELGGAEDLPPVQLEETQQVEIGPGTMDRLSQVVMVLVQNGILRLPDPGEIINVTPEEGNGA